MFRLQNNVPHVYVNESRDFQLLCRLYDASFSVSKHATDSLTHASDTQVCNESLLELLAYKLGLFKDLSCTTEQLRYILQVFPYLMRMKGSVGAIEGVLNLFHRLFGEGNEPPEFNIYSVQSDKYLRVVFPYDLMNTALLVELLQLLKPTGLFIHIDVVVAARPVTSVYTSDRVEYARRIDTTVQDAYNINSNVDLPDLLNTVNLGSVTDPFDSESET